MPWQNYKLLMLNQAVLSGLNIIKTVVDLLEIMSRVKLYHLIRFYLIVVLSKVVFIIILEVMK
jgi:hypothetical protein